MENMMQISPAAARVNAGYTQEEAAKLIGVTKQTIVNWEKGNSVPSTEKAQVMADVYQMPLQFIFFKRKSTVA